MKIKCKKCGDIIESKYLHDFRRCRCGDIFIDGGSSYPRIGYPGGKEEDECYEKVKEEVNNG